MTSISRTRAVGPAAHLLTAVLLAATAALPGPLGAQQNPQQAGAEALRVYLDCTGGFRGGGYCDSDLYRQEITFVNWVREPQDAQVHVILTTQDAGGGGDRFTLDFIGREELEGLEDEFTYTSSVTDVQDEVIEPLIALLRKGLVRYAVAGGFADDVVVQDVSPADRAERDADEDRQDPVDDPWDFWVFNLDGNFRIESEDRRESRNYGFGVNANRTTEEWKLNLRANGNFSREEFELQDSTVRNDQDRWSVSGFGVKTLGAHWGAGAELSADNSTQLNRDLRIGFGTGLEYNIFPYAESNRRVLLGRYVVSVERVQYQDTTIFDVLDETVYQHEVRVEYDAREPWGNANIGMGANQYLDRTDAWSFDIRGFVRYRLFRGFSVTVNGEFREVHDQIYLPKKILSDDDILLGRIQLPTSQEVEFRIGLSYSFGSIFNNAVNERFRRGVF